LWPSPLEDDPFHGAGDVGQLIQGVLNAVGNVLPAKDVLGQMLGGEVVQQDHDPATQLVTFVFQIMDGGQVSGQAFGVQLVRLRMPWLLCSAARSRTRACSVTRSRAW
jgi:hypothetical protein